MKIGIITYWNSLDNYGQQLQCYALQTLLNRWGHDAYLIRYAPRKEIKKAPLFRKLINTFKTPSRIINRLPIETRGKKMERLEKQLRQINLQINPERGFEQFRLDNLNMTERVYYTYDELFENPPFADVYITGSDQVWHDSLKMKTTQGWFLQFGAVDTKRISYAASMGRELSSDEESFFISYLKKFDAISVRELSTVSTCKRFGFDAQVCVDPTMLLNSDCYLKISQEVSAKEPYAFLYYLNVKSEDELYWLQISKYLKEEGLDLISVTASGYYQGRDLIKDHNNLLATIPEWLGAINGAQCVFTTSFHGTVFSILMHKPFLTIGLRGKYAHSNFRMEQLLEALGIPERMLTLNKSIRQQMENPIDWINVDARLEEMRRTSLDFLRINLK